MIKINPPRKKHPLYDISVDRETLNKLRHALGCIVAAGHCGSPNFSTSSLMAIANEFATTADKIFHV